jgi:murein DD-endopeptidase MepM/ murein hydrolase activator NlpD
MKKSYSLYLSLCVIIAYLFLTSSTDNEAKPEDSSVVNELQTKAIELKGSIFKLIQRSNSFTSDSPLPIASETSIEINKRINEITSTLKNDFPGNDQVSIAQFLSKQLWVINEISLLSNKRISISKSIPNLLPREGKLTSLFGYRIHPISKRVKKHDGIDISVPQGSNIIAPNSGVVVFAGRKGGYGNVVIIDHGYGYQTLYGHTCKMLVKEGDEVTAGQVIALVGSTGASTGPHLHYEVHVDGKKVDPQMFIPKNSFHEFSADVLPLLAVSPIESLDKKVN